MRNLILFPILVILSIGCTSEIKSSQEVDTMKLTSTSFKEGNTIPVKHTCDGNDISPELSIEGVPSNARSLALIMDDPDAPMGTFVHWVAWNIPATTKTIKEGESLQNEGMNDFGRSSYGGPCPPSKTHRYYFKLYALDTTLNIKATATKNDLEDAMKGHVLAEATLMGTYSRKKNS